MRFWAVFLKPVPSVEDLNHLGNAVLPRLAGFAGLGRDNFPLRVVRVRDRDGNHRRGVWGLLPHACADCSVRWNLWGLHGTICHLLGITPFGGKSGDCGALGLGQPFQVLEVGTSVDIAIRRHSNRTGLLVDVSVTLTHPLLVLLVRDCLSGVVPAEQISNRATSYGGEYGCLNRMCPIQAAERATCECSDGGAGSDATADGSAGKNRDSADNTTETRRNKVRSRHVATELGIPEPWRTWALLREALRHGGCAEGNQQRGHEKLQHFDHDGLLVVKHQSFKTEGFRPKKYAYSIHKNRLLSSVLDCPYK